ncbi:MAG TPA: hypothetical protein PKD70_06180 [Saprospiraceae bacterium]|nr:hypothetical protein [Saprospiraceae bacterium]HMP13445.1 hypothetical protein [Saprospiraceae bacterium]
MAFQPLVNGTAYSWSQIIVNILGIPVAGVTGVSYTEEQEMQDNYGAGNRPVSRGYGNITTEGSVTLHMEEVEALQAAISTGRLQDIPEFDIVVAFLPEGGVITTHTLKNCRFKTNGRDLEQNQMAIEVELDLQIAQILWK